jgi:hypothetical protein
MKKIIALFIVAAMCGLIADAKPKAYILNVPTGAKTAVTNTFGGEFGISGAIKEIYVACSDLTQTADVRVAYSPLDGYAASINLATNEIVGSKSFAPCRDLTDVKGTALTSDQPISYYLTGESMSVIILNTQTGLNWRVTVKVDE